MEAFHRLAFIRKYKRGDNTYYALVENYQDEQGRARQRTLEYLDKNPDRTPGPTEIDGADFGALVVKLMDKSLTPEDLSGFLERMGDPVSVDELEAVGFQFFFQENKILLYAYPAKPETT